jgi:hypothetical protein
VRRTSGFEITLYFKASQRRQSASQVKHAILARYSVAHVELQQQGLRSKSGRTFFLKQLALFSSLPSHRLGLPVIRLQHLVALGTA